MTYHYCTCTLDESKKKLVEYGRTPYRLVQVNGDDECLDCGYCTVSTGKLVDPKSGQLYTYITGYKSKEEKRIYKRNYGMTYRGSRNENY